MRGSDQGYYGQATVVELPPYLPSLSQSHDVTLRASDFNRIMIRELAMGWPLRSARYYAVWLYNDDDPTKSQHFVRGAWFYPTSVEDQFFGSNLAMPLIPIWPGLLFNALFYYVIWFGVFFGIGSTRRVIRRKRGRCPMCSYDLRGSQSLIGQRVLNPPPDSQAGCLRHQSAGCPECGRNRVT